ncbi:NADPH-dependent F420 reductase [Allosphingosinicella deserti]|uniref:NADP oxidoreductase n=1 Tax=Allosphingosinicella deserti TaxID=2116704 RepID=A0A2P7QZN0_9SPHN|nr:NADPH-dependent F420 reductase [Sphingomonas deserti]PSJ43420.1 NADP oxidoreductase [Sphingomonas deserti]
MKYAIIGSGAIGSAIARQFARIDTPVAVANSRGPEAVEPLAQELGAAIVPKPLADALKADIVIVATPFDAVPSALEQAGAWNGRILVDTTNALNYSDFSPLDLGGRPSTEIVEDHAPGARVVKAFNHNWARVLGREASDGRDGSRVLFVSGNHVDANAEIAELIRAFGFTPIILGRLDEGGLLQQFRGPLTTYSLVSQAQGGASAPEMDLLNP